MEIYRKSLARRIIDRAHIDQHIANAAANLFCVKRFQRKDYFTRAGEASDEIGFIIDGVFSMHVIHEDGSHFIKSFVCENQFLLATFEPGQESTINLQALTPSIILSATYSDVQAFIGQDPRLVRWESNEIKKELEQVYKNLEELASKDAMERYLLFMDRFPHLSKRIPQHAIASYLGVTPTQLSRIRKNLMTL